MPTLFVSHASADDKWANALAQWLDANGFTDRFLDHEAILAGEKWAEKLRESAGACRLVICLISERARRALGYLVVDLGSLNSRTSAASAGQAPPTFSDSEMAYGLATTVMLSHLVSP